MGKVTGSTYPLTITAVPPGTPSITLSVKKPGFADTNLGPIALPAQGSPPPQTVALAYRYTTAVSGTVKDQASGTELHNAEISASTAPGTTIKTAPDGSFSIPVKHTGSFTLTVSRRFYQSFTTPSLVKTTGRVHNAGVIELIQQAEPVGADRFSLQNTGTASNPAYTLTIADGVRTITAGEFASNGGTTTTSTTANTRLTALGSNPHLKVTAIKLPPEFLIRIENQAFLGHHKAGGELTIPASVEHIGEAAFYDLSKTAASVSESVDLKFARRSKLKFIGHRAFMYARIRAFPTLPQSLETIEANVFRQAMHLPISNFVIPENVSKVGDRAFETSGTINGTLTIKSPSLTRTPALDPSAALQPTKTGRLGNNIFTSALIGTPATPFTTIILPRAVFNSYSQTDRNAVFGTGGTYKDLADPTGPDL